MHVTIIYIIRGQLLNRGVQTVNNCASNMACCSALPAYWQLR